jgi:hypothetical protein
MHPLQPQAPPDNTGRPHTFRTFGLIFAATQAAVGLVLFAAWAFGSDEARLPTEVTRPTPTATQTWPTGGPIPNSFPTTTAPEVVEPAVKPKTPLRKDALYLSTVRDKYPEAEAITDTTLIGLSKSACKVLASGGTGEDLIGVLSEGTTPERGLILSYAVGAGVVIYCPQYADLLERTLP